MVRNFLLYAAGFVVCAEGLNRLDYGSLLVASIELILGSVAIIASLTWEER